MKKLFLVLAMSSLAVVVADAAEQDTVNRCTAIISQFQQMPEKAIPRDVLRRAKGLAIMSVVKAGFIFSYYGEPVRADSILSGVTKAPPGAAPLRRALGP